MGKAVIDVQVDASGASSGLARLGAAFDHLDKRTASGTKGIQSVEIGLRTLAAQAVGVHGPLARVAEGLLSFAGGGTMVLAVAAGIGIVTLVMKQMGAEAKKAAEETKQLEDRLKSLSAHGGVVAASMRISELEIEKKRIERELTRGSGAPSLYGLFFGAAADRERLGAKIIDINKQIATITNQELIPAEQKVTEQKQKQLQTAAQQLEAEAKLTAELQKQIALIGEGVEADLEKFYKKNADIFQQSFEAVLAMRSILEGGTPQTRMWWEVSPTMQTPDFAELGRIGNAGTPGAGTDRGAMAGIIAQAIASVASGARGGISGAVTGIGGALGSLSGLSGLAGLGPIGAGVAAGGAVISLLGGLFSSSKPAVVMIDGYSSTAINQQQQIMQILAGFLGLKVDVLSAGSATPEGAAHVLGRMSRLDGGMRLPPGSLR